MPTVPSTLHPAEQARLAALHALAMTEAGSNGEFQALVTLAEGLLGFPTVMQNLVERNQVRVFAATAPVATCYPRHEAFCDTTVRTDATLVIDDLTRDPRFAALPLVSGPEGLRFYAGAPIHTTDDAGVRQPIGTLCAVDVAPRAMSASDRRTFAHLVTLAEALIAARATAARAVALARESELQAAELARKDRIFRQAERMAMIGSFRLSLDDQRLEWSDNVYRIHGLPVGEAPPVDGALDHYPPAARARVSAGLARTIETGEPFAIEENFSTAQAERRRVRAMAELETVDGQPVGVVGVFQDVTDRYEMEMALRRSADTDMLTGLANRAAFERALDAAIGRAHDGGSPLLLAMIDLDGFKEINDTLGHLAGDDVLRGVGKVLRAPWLGGACAARLGGDEFALIVEDAGLIADRAGLIRRLEDGLRIPVCVDGLGMIAAGTVGLANHDADHATARDLVHAADTLLYAIKRERRGDRRRGERRRRG